LSSVPLASTHATSDNGKPGTITTRPSPMPGILPPLTVEQILAWADAHHAATSVWPGDKSGPVIGQPGEDWGPIFASARLDVLGLFMFRSRRLNSWPQSA
jgi:hypothetical protein